MILGQAHALLDDAGDGPGVEREEVLFLSHGSD
jgi:hypothetical protein